MKVRREYRRRDETEVAVLEALADRYEEGMTVFELRSEVGTDIDDLETALSNLKEADLIAADEVGGRTHISVDDSVVEAEATGSNDEDIISRIIDRLGL
jgi:predicted transcriptional regulator